MNDLNQHREHLKRKFGVENLSDEQVSWSLEQDRLRDIERSLSAEFEGENVVRLILDVFNLVAKVNADRQGLAFNPVNFDDLPTTPVMQAVDLVRVSEEALSAYQRTYGVPFLVRDCPQSAAAEPVEVQP